MSQELSQDFIDMIEATNRKFYGKAVFETEAYDDANYYVETSSSIGAKSKAEVNDGVFEIDSRIASGEQNRFKLDGRTRVYGSESVLKYGYISSSLSDANGDFASPITVTFTFSPAYLTRPKTIPLSILFDTMNKTFPIDFDVKISNISPTYENLIEVRGNESSTYYYLEDNYLDTKSKITITIYNWSEPFTRCRITEAALMVYKEYSPNADDKLLNYSFTSETDILFNKLVGNNATLELSNEDKIFNMLSDDGFGFYFEEGTQVSLYLGIKREDLTYEFYKIATLFVKSWEVKGFRVAFNLQDFFQYLSSFDARSVLWESVG